jgi:hypothetical protein
MGRGGENEIFVISQRYSRSNRAEYARKAVAGIAVDRQLLGYRILAGQAGLAPAIFSDPAYARSSDWALSTSQLPLQ